MSDVEVLHRMLERERSARKEAEQLLESKSRELFLINRELAETAEQLKDQVHKTRTIMNSASEGMVVFDEHGIIETLNPAAEEIFGIKTDDAIGTHLCRFIPSAESCDRFSSDVCCLQFKLPENIRAKEYCGVHKTGFAIPLEVSFSRVNYRNTTFFLAIVRDLTGKKQIETQLAQSQKLEAVGQLAAGIAHEINTPIQYVGDNTRFLKTSFQDILQLLQIVEDVLMMDAGERRQELIESARSYIETMDLEFLKNEIPLAIDQALQGAESVTRIVRAMKEFSHPGSDEKQLVDLNQTIESTLTVSRNEWKYVCELQCELDPNLPHIPCFPSELNQALLNLFINAAHAVEANDKHNGENRGKLIVRTYQDHDWVTIEVGDTGCGIPTRIQNRIFDPFFTTKPVGKGTGQGLAIAYNVIVNKHHGKIEFESAEGEGTTFFLRLPLHEMAATSKIAAGVA